MENPAGNTLEHVCLEAHRAAWAAGKPILAHYTFPLPGARPLAMLAALGESAPFRFYWEQPVRKLALAAGGSAKALSAEGEGRFSGLAAALEEVFRNTVSGDAAGGPVQGPFALGGFSFFEALHHQAWEGFRAAELVVPSWMVLSRGNTTVGMVTLEVNPQDSPTAFLAAMEEICARLEQGFRTSAEGAPRAGVLYSTVDGETGHRDWLTMVAAAAADIRAGELDKVVLARAVDLSCSEEPSPYPILANLRDAYPDCYTFLVDPGRGQFFLGATPERLVGKEGNEISLGALAGTAARGEHQAADEALAGLLMEGHKERLEHQIVVDAILAAVGDLGEVERPAQPEILKLSNLQHLFTPLTLHPNRPVGLLSLVERLHPTPAVGGHPTAIGLKKMQAYETFERGWYAAPVGWIEAGGNGEFAVALRSALFGGKRVRAFAGNGILADSDPEREYQETQLKLRPILAAFANE